MANSQDVTYTQIPDSIVKALMEYSFDSKQDKKRTLFSLANISNDLTNFRSQLIEKRLEVLKDPDTQSTFSGAVNLVIKGYVSQPISDYNKILTNLKIHVSKAINGADIKTQTDGIIATVVNALDSDASKTARAMFEAEKATDISLSINGEGSYKKVPLTGTNKQISPQR